MPAQSSFAANLRTERDQFAAFCQLLEAEQTCLLQADVEGLLEMAQSKSQHVDRLMELAAQRASFLQQQGVGRDNRAIAVWLAANAEDEVAQVWRELVEHANRARALNETNGMLITTRLSHNQAALAALHAVSHANDLYGPTGQAELPPARREIGRA